MVMFVFPSPSVGPTVRGKQRQTQQGNRRAQETREEEGVEEDGVRESPPAAKPRAPGKRKWQPLGHSFSLCSPCSLPSFARSLPYVYLRWDTLCSCEAYGMRHNNNGHNYVYCLHIACVLLQPGLLLEANCLALVLPGPRIAARTPTRVRTTTGLQGRLPPGPGVLPQRRAAWPSRAREGRRGQGRRWRRRISVTHLQRGHECQVCSSPLTSLVFPPHRTCSFSPQSRGLRKECP